MSRSSPARGSDHRDTRTARRPLVAPLPVTVPLRAVLLREMLLRQVLLIAVLGLATLLAGCTSSPGGTGSASSTPTSTAAPLTITVSIADRKVSPSGRRIDVSRGQTVVLHVTSDMDDEIHAHTAGDGYELEVKAGVPATGGFVAADTGSFEIESHHLEQVIAILDVR